MVVEAGPQGPRICAAAEASVILLDTHAAIWLAQGHRRAAPLQRFPRLYLSPISLLEIQFLSEAGRLRLARGRSRGVLADDERWQVDEPPALKWCAAACELAWTRDPFDRLIAAHARIRRWRLATADDELLKRLAPAEVLEL
jgi:PIN domain nuclease of toxin-antitoxin system